MLKNKVLKISLVIFLTSFVIFDLGYSFRQYLSNRLDWDMAGGIVPAQNVKPVLDNPLGFKAIIHGEKYPNPNRFFSHWVFYKYYNTMPFILQKYMHPIESVYWSSAIFKIVVHFGLLIILGIFITGTKNIFSIKFLTALAILTPFFQIYGYQSIMGIVDKSNTYTFFYPFPLLLMCIYLLPLALKYLYKQNIRFGFLFFILWMLFAMIVNLSGPLNPGISLIIIFLFCYKELFSLIKQNKSAEKIKLIDYIRKLNTETIMFLFPLLVFAVYSLILGRYNDVDTIYSHSIIDLYKRLPIGLFNQLTQKIGYPLLIVSIIINIILLKKITPKNISERWLKMYKYLFAFIILYILLLPLGGYRDYRPNVLRYDTMMPVTLTCILIFSASVVLLLKYIKHSYWYYIFFIGILAIFTFADKPILDENLCEKDALYKISQSKEEFVDLECDCTVMSWNKEFTYEEASMNSELLKLWNITDKKINFSNK